MLMQRCWCVSFALLRFKPPLIDAAPVYTNRRYRQDVAILYLSSRVVAAARKLLVAYRVRLCQQGFGPYGGGSTPSSGCDPLPVAVSYCPGRWIQLNQFPPRTLEKVPGGPTHVVDFPQAGTGYGHSVSAVQTRCT
jgi:hypothetical protein